MTVTISKHFEALVDELVREGCFLGADEVVENALYLLKDEYALYKVKREELRKEIQIGIDQADRGELIEGELVFDRLHAKVEAALGKVS